MAANVRFSNPKTLAKPPGYSYVVEATGPNRLIFIAGQLGLDLENTLVGSPGEFRAQADKAIENLKLALGRCRRDRSRTWSRSTTISSTCRTSRSSARCATTTSTWRPRRQARRSRSLNWRGRARCSRSRRSRCCRRRLQKRRGRNRPRGAPAARSRRARSASRHRWPLQA